MKKALSLLICLLSFMVVFTACSGGGSKTNTTNNSGTGGGNTQINDTQQGAQTSITTRNIANEVIGSFGLTNLVGSGSVANGLGIAKALRKFAWRIKPVIQNARSFKASQTQENCIVNGIKTFDDLDDDLDITEKRTYSECIDEEGVKINGVIELRCYDSKCNTITIKFGSGNEPFVMTTYDDNGNNLYQFSALVSITLPIEDYPEYIEYIEYIGSDMSYTNYEISITADGYTEYGYWDYTTSFWTKERNEMNNFGLVVKHEYEYKEAEDSETETYYITANGSVTETKYKGNNLVLSEKYSFSKDFKVNYTYDYEYEYLTINGTFGIDLTPDACIEGTFNIVTVEALQTELSTYQIIAGELIINDNTTVIYSLDEEGNTIITVTVNGQSYTFSEAELNNLCPLITD